MSARGVIEVNVHDREPDEVWWALLEAIEEATRTPIFEHPLIYREVVVIHGHYGGGRGSTYRLLVRWLCIHLSRSGHVSYRLGEDTVGNPGRTVICPSRPIDDLPYLDLERRWKTWAEEAKRQRQNHRADTELPQIKLPRLHSRTMTVRTALQGRRTRSLEDRTAPHQSSVEGRVLNYCDVPRSLAEVYTSLELLKAGMDLLETQELLERLVVWGRLQHAGYPMNDLYVRCK